MLSRALILAAVAFALGCFGAIPADAQNLEAGKAPSQIFSSTCSLCHKSARGLLKSVSPGSLPGFLRQHYTTSTDMAAAMSAFVLSNGAASAPVAGGNLTKQGQDSKTGAAPEPGAEPAGRGRKPPSREAARPDSDGLQEPSGAPSAPESAQTARQKAAAERRAARQAAKSKAGLPPKDEARHEAPKEEPGKDETARTEPGVEPPKTEAPEADTAKTETAKGESPKPDGTRPDPVPAVTPAPPAPEKGPETAAIAPPKPVVDDPNRPLTIDVGPAPSPPRTPAIVVSAPPSAPAGKPEPPISR